MNNTSFSANLKNALEQKTPFVFYRKPNNSLVHQLIQQDLNLYYLDNYLQNGFVFSPFNDSDKSIIFPLDKCLLTSHPFEINSFSEMVLEETSNNSDKENHLNLVKNGIDFIKNQQTPKIVLSRKETIQTSTFNLVKTFENLLNKYPTAFVYVWYHPKVGLWLGATPETLINTQNNTFKTMALAGTQVYKNTLNVTWKNKEIQEHQFVTDYIVTQLNKMEITCNISDTTTIKAGNLLHLQANISGRLKDKSQIGNLIQALHPTPAVCGVPKEKAKKFILKNENYDREFYTGFLGELNFETDKRKKINNKRNIENHAYNFKEIKSALFVNLRCMQIKNNEINIYVGGGITKDSNPEKEYFETVAKAEIMKSVIRF